MLLQEAAGQGWEEDRGGGRWWPGGDRAEEEDGGVSKHFRAAIFFQGAWIFVHSYFHEDQTFLCSTIFTRSKHFLHQHFCKDFHASIFLQGTITFPASISLQEASNFIHNEQKKNLWWNLCLKYVIASWVLLMPQIPPAILLSLEIHNSLSRKVNWQSQYDPRLKFTQPKVFMHKIHEIWNIYFLRTRFYINSRDHFENKNCKKTFLKKLKGPNQVREGGLCDKLWFANCG